MNPVQAGFFYVYCKAIYLQSRKTILPGTYLTLSRELDIHMLSASVLQPISTPSPLQRLNQPQKGVYPLGAGLFSTVFAK
ncbi:hypothetical protein [Aeromonas popoffii]|uniref:hypothetical protein n=1 Tax=Aeromonas popoffii TaxID=70856 RepID=UPI0030D46BFA